MVTACKALTAATSGLTQWLIALGCWASQEAMKDQLQHLKGSQVSRQPSQQAGQHQDKLADKLAVCRSTPPALRAALKVKLVASTVREELTM